MQYKGPIREDDQMNAIVKRRWQYLARIDVAAVAVDVGVVGVQDVHIDVGVLRDHRAVIAGLDDVVRRAVLARDAETERLATSVS